MKFPAFCKLSIKYLWRYRRRYLFLFIALGFGFAVVSAISSLKDGVKENLYLSAQSHYAGDIMAIGYEDSEIGQHLTETEINSIMAAAGRANIQAESIAVRTSLYGKRKGTVYFNGNAVSLKYLVGVDWEREKSYFDKLSYTTDRIVPDDSSILLSAPIALELGARQGDSIILEVLTATGQKNTGVFITTGIIEDSSFFGYYKVFMSRSALNSLIGFAEEDCSLIGFFLKDRANIETKRKALFDELQGQIRIGQLVYDRDAFYEVRGSKEGITVLLLTLSIYLSEVAQLINAIDLASWALYAMMLAIIMVSAGVTCRLILHERIKETGTMRAIGFYESDLRFILKLEILCLAILSLIAGFLLSMLINWALSYSSFGWFPGFEIVMQDGRLNALYLPGTVAVNILAVLLILAAAVWGPVFRNVRLPLPDMLKGGIT